MELAQLARQRRMQAENLVTERQALGDWCETRVLRGLQEVAGAATIDPTEASEPNG